MTLTVGARLGPYEIRAALGAGGMGEVYRARDPRLGREVAIKVLPAALSNDLERLHRFEQEARAAAALNHPNIVTIYSVEAADGIPFLTMELIEGQPLGDLIPKGGMPLDRLLAVATPIADALAAAHGKGITHRDLKPANIMVDIDGRPKILDFGLAKLQESSPAALGATALPTQRLTLEGRIVGTVEYMSPEQAEGKPVDQRSDIFSLGVILYEMATGKRPFTGGTSVALLSSILKDRPHAVADVNPSAPRELSHIIKRCLVKDVDRRYQSAKDLRNELEDLRLEHQSGSQQISLGAGSRAEAATRLHAPPRAAAGRKAGYVVTLSILVALVVIGLITGRHWLAGPSPGGRIDSIAVLPFVNANTSADTEYLSDGISEGLINDLSRLPGLKVVAYSSSLRFKGKAVEPRAAASALGVHAIVTGRVVQRANTFQVSAELVDARTDEHIWGEQYTRTSADVLRVQRELASEIGARVRGNLTLVERQQFATTTPANREAYEWLLKGRYSFRKTSPEGTKQAVEYYQQAIKADPNFALAHAELAFVYGTWRELFDQKEIAPKARAAAMKALALDERLPEGHQALARLMRNAWDWAGAEREYTRALELNPNHVEAHNGYATFLSVLGRHEQAIAEGQRARELDPLDPFTTINLGQVFYFARRYDLAIAALNRQLELDPTSHLASFYLGPVYAAKGDYPTAIASAQQALTYSGDTASQCYLGYVLGMAGRRREAVAIRDQLERGKQSTGLADLAVLYLGLGDRTRVLDLLEQAYDAHDAELQYLRSAPYYDHIRADARFQNLIRRVGLPP